MRGTYSSREFDHDTAAAIRDAGDGPVFITDRGRASHVLLTIDDYLKLRISRPSIIDIMEAGPDMSEIDLELPTRSPSARSMDLD